MEQICFSYFRQEKTKIITTINHASKGFTPLLQTHACPLIYFSSFSFDRWNTARNKGPMFPGGSSLPTPKSQPFRNFMTRPGCVSKDTAGHKDAFGCCAARSGLRIDLSCGTDWRIIVLVRLIWSCVAPLQSNTIVMELHDT